MARPVVLCVDDERGILDVLREQLHRRLGRECVMELADSGDDALAIVDELVDNGDDIAVVISDQIMPGMKGDELLAKVHEPWLRLSAVAGVCLLVAAVFDVVAEVRFRWAHRDAAAVLVEQRPYVADAAVAALAEVGIPAGVRNTGGRGVQ